MRLGKRGCPLASPTPYSTNCEVVSSNDFYKTSSHPFQSRAKGVRSHNEPLDSMVSALGATYRVFPNLPVLVRTRTLQIISSTPEFYFLTRTDRNIFESGLS